VNRLAMALAAYVVIGVLVWSTISDSRIRLVTLAILGVFALKTWLHRKDAGPVEGGADRDSPM
jgi:hypothetical protein